MAMIITGETRIYLYHLLERTPASHQPVLITGEQKRG